MGFREEMERDLRAILGDNSVRTYMSTETVWRGRRVGHCGLCGSLVVWCPNCKHLSCDGMVCPECERDFKDFRRLVGRTRPGCQRSWHC